MKYIYRNVTHETQSVLLADKEQTFVNTKMFAPGATLELDYPGLNLYVPNILSCIAINTPKIVNEETTSIKQVEHVEKLEKLEKPINVSKNITIEKPTIVEKPKPKINMKKTAKKAKH